MNLRPANFDFWIKNDLNVLLRGKHGVGKTAMVTDAFERNNLKYKYFSAATMDPWVDFIGVPKEMSDDNGDSYLDLVRPKEFQDDEVEAIFMDEFSRAHKKVRNAVMELIQFKSINGRKFKNLRFVWAAINPEDDEDFNYDVDALDPAQEDRFHVQVEVPYKPDVDWFRSQFGEQLANSAISWWNELPPKVQNRVTPRRLEYALSVYNAKGNLRHVLPSSSNVSKLSRVLTDGPIQDKLVDLLKKNNTNLARKFISIENNYRDGLSYIIDDVKLREFFVPLFDKEKISNLLASRTEVYKLAVQKIENGDETFKQIAKDIVNANQNKKLTKKLMKDLHHVLSIVDMSELKHSPQIAHFSDLAAGDYDRYVKTASKMVGKTTNQRKDKLQVILDYAPEQMTREAAKQTLQVIDDIAERSHSYTIASPEVVGVVNNCIRTLAVSADGKSLTWENIVTEHGSIMANFIQKMKDASRFQKVYQPGRYGQNEDKIVSEMCGVKKSSSSSKKTKSSTTTLGGQLG
tara:strand:+ start:3498 stop:5051 length:1554 start_codon:yes stop_codon:yes gene_type:complete